MAPMHAQFYCHTISSLENTRVGRFCPPLPRQMKYATPDTPNKIGLMAIFLKHLWLIPNILKWQDCKIFTKLVPLQTPSRSSHRRCSVKKGVLKNLRNFTGKHLYWSLFLIKLQTFRPATLLRRDSNTGFFLWNLQSFYEHLFEEHLRTTASDKT